MTAPAPAPAPGSRPRILLVEDDTRLAGAYARRLEAEHLDVDVVSSIADARDHERQGPYAGLVLDRLLPDGDILDLVREIDDRPTRPPIVVVSGVADQEDRIEGLLAGADDYVAKPVHLDELAVRVTRLVGAPNVAAAVVEVPPADPMAIDRVGSRRVGLRLSRRLRERAAGRRRPS